MSTSPKYLAIIHDLRQAWSNPSMKVDWLKLEDLLVAILRADDVSDEVKFALIRESIDATTRRGHFEDLPYASDLG